MQAPHDTQSLSFTAQTDPETVTVSRESRVTVLLEGLDVLILDALRHAPHPTHLSLGEAVEIARTVKPKQAFFTHICHDLEHQATNAALPENMALAHDGLSVLLT